MSIRRCGEGVPGQSEKGGLGSDGDEGMILPARLHKRLFREEIFFKAGIEFNILFVEADDGEIVGKQVYQFQVRLGKTAILPYAILLEEHLAFFARSIVDFIKD